jgi:GNAT superfamily N-acetyltransferase
MTLYTLAERPDLRGAMSAIHDGAWAPFMAEFPVANRAWDHMFEHCPDFQIALCDEEEKVLAVAHALPIAWDGDPNSLPPGWEASMEKAMRDHRDGVAPTALTAYAIVVAPGRQGHGHSSTMLAAMCDAARKHGLRAVIACVRPSLKALYPLIPFERYIHWKRDDGSPFDPWIRVHWRAGAQVGRPEVEAMTLEAPISDWEKWTGLKMPESGRYVVNGALQPVEVDRERGTARYHDPNVWMVHRVG